MCLMVSSTVILKIIHRNMAIVVGSYVHDDELLERLCFLKKLYLSDTFKNCIKSSKNLLLSSIMQRVDEFSFFKCNIYALVLPWYNDFLKSLMVK